MPELDRTDVQIRLREIISRILDCSLPKSSESVNMVDLPAWDSMAQVQIIVAIEKEFLVEADTELVEAQSLTALEIAVAKLLT